MRETEFDGGIARGMTVADLQAHLAAFDPDMVVGLNAGKEGWFVALRPEDIRVTASQVWDRAVRLG